MKSPYENHLSQEEPRWFAVYTKYKNEKSAGRLLEEKGINSYVPLQKFVRQYLRKRKEVELPLFSCYLFVKIIKSEYVRVLETPGVVKFVRFSQNLIAIPENEIRLIRRILGEEMDIQTEKGNWNIGDEVEIIAGNLTGLKGRVMESKGKHNFVVALKQLDFSLLMTMDRKLLRKVGVPLHQSV